MKRYITIITIALGCLVGQSCSHFDDMNKNPYAAEEVSPASFIQTITFATQSKILSTSYNLTSQLMQHAIAKSASETTTLVYNYECNISHTTTFWDLYVQKGNAESMLAEARKDGDTGLEGVALILRTYVMQILTDVYGDVPYFQAGLMSVQPENIETNLKYDSQKEIYRDMLLSLETANKLLNPDSTATTKNFSAALDKIYGGSVASWRKFGNTLYLRLLMRVSNKVIEEDEGMIDLGDEYDPFDVREKIREIYDSRDSESGQYPIFQSVDDRAFVSYNSLNSLYYTPFETTTGTLFGQIVACETLVNKMAPRNDKGTPIMIDPRYYQYFTTAVGLPVHWMLEDVDEFWEANKDEKGKSLIGTYSTRLKSGTESSLLNYSEPLFVFAEASCRGYIQGDTRELYLDACEASMEEWNPDDVQTNKYVKKRSVYREELAKIYDSIPAEKVLEAIMEQKWIASFWYGVEAWSDYRRTGYPVLKTNGPAALNDKILCTRMRYPYTEPYQNGKCYQEAVDGWLGGSDDMQTDVWFADTQKSKSIREQGLQ